MKKIVYTLIIYLFTTQVYFAQDVVSTDEKILEIPIIKLNWISTYKESLKKSKKEKKPVLIYFTGSDWCGPCKILDKDLFNTARFKDLADKSLILLEVDIPRRLDIISPEKMFENTYIQEKYNVKSFPTLMIVNHRGKKLAEKKGYVLTDYYYPFLQSEIDSF
jgi:thioredoxin-related protein